MFSFENYPNIQTISNVSEFLRDTLNIWDSDHVRTIFKTKHTLCGTLMKTGFVRDVQQMKQCVYNISCDCGRCYISETSRSLEVWIKEHTT
jgi:hypothetical protein